MQEYVEKNRISFIIDSRESFKGNLDYIKKEFEKAVDDYLEFCKEVGKEPDKEYKGTFNVRIQPELHKRLALVALMNGETLNASVEKAIREYVNQQK